MLAINVQETTATTGAGDITLVGASEDGRTFSSQYSTGFPIFYYIDDRAGNFEHGIGHLSSSNVLVRDNVIRSSNSDSLVSFASGTKYVFAGQSDTILNRPKGTAVAGAINAMYYGEQSIVNATSYTERSTQLWLTPFVNTSPAEFSKWAVYVETASAGAVMRAGIYLVDYDTGLPVGDPILESDDIDMSATGYVTLDFSNNVTGGTSAQRLPNYFFMGLAFEDATMSISSVSYTSSPKTWLGSGADGRARCLYQGFTLGTPAAGVAVLPTIGTMSSRAENYPNMGFAE